MFCLYSYYYAHSKPADGPEIWDGIEEPRLLKVEERAPQVYFLNYIIFFYHDVIFFYSLRNLSELSNLIHGLMNRLHWKFTLNGKTLIVYQMKMLSWYVLHRNINISYLIVCCISKNIFRIGLVNLSASQLLVKIVIAAFMLENSTVPSPMQFIRRRKTSLLLY